MVGDQDAVSTDTSADLQSLGEGRRGTQLSRFSSRELCQQTHLGEWQHIHDLEQKKEQLDSVHRDQSHMSLSLQLGKLRTQ